MKKLCVFLASLLLVGIQMVQAQTVRITGTVTSSEDGMPLPGVSVIVKGTTIGGSTDVNGKYEISAPANAQSLTFSFIGFVTQDLAIAGRTVIDAVMESESKQIEEVVITAMGVKKIPDAVTSSQKIVSAKDMNAAGSPSAVQALTAKVSGLQINLTNSGVVESNSIVLRGKRSITGNNQALIVIDGVKSSASVFQQLPPEVIKTVNVIKGAQGASLYGSDGVNGVILVTTVGARKTDNVRVTVNQKVDFDTPAYFPERQRKYGQGWDGEKINVENGAWGPAFTDPAFAGQVVTYGVPLYDYNNDGVISVNPSNFDPMPDDPAALKKVYAPFGKDNVADFFVTGVTSSTDVTIDASGENKYGLFSAGYGKRNFVVEGDKYEKYSLLFKGGIEVGRWNIEGIFNYMHRNTTQTNSSIYYDLLQSSSDVPITSYSDYPDLAYGWNIYYTNPYWFIKHNRYDNKSDYFNAIATVGFKINDHINVKYVANFQNSLGENLNHRDDWAPTVRYNLEDASAISSFLNKNNSSRKDYYGDLLLNFDYKLTDDLGLKALVGTNYQDNSYSITSAGGTNLIIPGVYAIYNLAKPTTPINLPNGTYHKNSYAVFTSLDFAYKDYLYLNATARNEWSSILPKNNNSYFYPSVGVSFIPTKVFDELTSVLSSSKIAASITRVGKTSSIDWYDINDVATLGTGFPFALDGPTLGGLSFGDSRQPTNPDIKPEFITTKELTIELGFLDNRIILGSSLYQADTKDMITYQTTSSASGISLYQINIGKMRTKGVEVDLTLTPVRTKDLTWNVNLSYTHANSEIVKVSDATDEISLQANAMVGIYAKAGESFPLIKANAYQRDAEGRIIIDAATGNPLYTSELIEFGTTDPKHTFGLSTAVSFKGLRFSVVMDYRTGHKFYSNTAEGFTFNGMLKESAEFDRTQGGFIMPNSVIEDPANPGSYIPNTSVKTGGDDYQGVSTYYSSIYNRIGENFIFDASAFKVREIALSYTLNKKQLRNYLEAVTIGVYARNPFTILGNGNLHYNDPETSNTTGNSQGIADDNQYPVLKTYGFNVSFNF